MSADALLASARASTARIGAQQGEPWLCVLPTAHIAGLQVLLRARLLDAPDYPFAGALAALAVEQLGERDVREVVESGTHPVLSLPLPIYLRRPDARVPSAPKKVSS